MTQNPYEPPVQAELAEAPQDKAPVTTLAFAVLMLLFGIGLPIRIYTQVSMEPLHFLFSSGCTIAGACALILVAWWWLTGRLA
jgi:hypothetical protein